jgi:hypothetical protein
VLVLALPAEQSASSVALQPGPQQPSPELQVLHSEAQFMPGSQAAPGSPPVTGVWPGFISPPLTSGLVGSPAFEHDVEAVNVTAAASITSATEAFCIDGSPVRLNFCPPGPRLLTPLGDDSQLLDSGK